MSVDARIEGRIGTLAIDLAFSLPSGVISALTGPSGAGKTTVLRWLAGLVAIPGRLTVDGQHWQKGSRPIPVHRRSVGMVFQGQGLLPHLSVGANLAYAARRAEAPLDIAELAGRTGIAALLDRSPVTLSGGEAQRASLARALIRRPRLLLLDEPLSALDAEARAELAATLERLLPSMDVTVLLVSHDAGEVARLAQHVIRISNGRLLWRECDEAVD